LSTAVCYLCGAEVAGQGSRDHVPPRHIFPKRLREQHRFNLLTLPVHVECNKDYEKDEEYFVNTLAPAIEASPVQRALWHDLWQQFSKPRGRILGEMVRKEFYKVDMPGGMRAKTFNGRRVRRVVAKTVRGLFFHEQRRFLPLRTPCRIEIFGPHDWPPDELREVIAYAASSGPKGRYPEVFDYRYRDQRVDLSGVGRVHLWFWAMVFWGQLLALTVFHDPGCQCSKCRPDSNRAP
jgi:hypothetical protein